MLGTERAESAGCAGRRGDDPGRPVRTLAELGLTEGDVIEIVGKRSTPARALRPYGEDEALDIVRLDGLQRANAGVGSGDYVEVRKAASKPATRVVFAPAQPNVRLQGSAEALRESLTAITTSSARPAGRPARTASITML